MTSKEPECRLMLCHCLAIILRKEGCQSDPGDFWMYESGYLLFQGLLAANSICWWNNALQGAVRGLTYKGYVSPGALLVASDPCALEVLRSAWSRRVLQPPAGYQIVGLEDVEDFQVSRVSQTQWTPLTEAVCSVVLRLSSQGRPAGLESIRECLILAFPHVSPPTEEMIYDTLVQLMAERKLYNTSKGYFIVTPERRRSRSHSHGRKKNLDGVNGKPMLMSNEEALIYVHGEIATIRDGDVTHQCIQTNLADVICGGNSSDKIIYPQSNKRRSASFPIQKNPDGRNSFRIWNSSRRLRRSASTRTIARNCTDSGSSTEYPNSSSDSAQTPKKQSLISRIFRRSKRSHSQMNSLNAQFPPTEWFNSKTIHLHCIGTQTSFGKDDDLSQNTYKMSSSELGFSRSATLPRRHRHISNDSEAIGSFPGSRDNSPKHSSPSRTSTLLPQNGLKVPSRSIRKNSRSSLSPKTFTPTTGNSSTEIYEGQKQTESITDVNKTSSAESIKASHFRKNSRGLQKSDLQDGTKDADFTPTTDKFQVQANSSDTKSSVSVDNSGPSSIESQKSERTGSSLTSGPSSLESNRTVIKKNANSSTPLHSLRKSTSKSKESSPKSKQVTPEHKSKLTQSNSFTLQVTTNQHAGNTTSSSATINSGNGTNAKIYVQNSPVRSVITFENGQNNDSNVVIISGKDLNAKTQNHDGSENEDQEQDNSKRNFVKNINSLQTKEDNTGNLNNSKDFVFGSDVKNEAMNNNRKLSLQLSPKESLNYYNMIKNVSSSTNKKNSCNSNPESPKFNSFALTSAASDTASPTKSCDNISAFNDVFIRNMSESKNMRPNNCIEKNILGSEPNISCKVQDYRDKGLSRELSQEQEFPSLTDLSFNFTSLAAQKILKGVSINSIDTLVELNTASGEKQNNYDVVHTDFGLV